MPSKPTKKPDKHGKIIFQSYGLRKPRPCVQNFNCIICNKKFTSQGTLNQHIMDDHSEGHFTCTHCNRQFKTTNGHYKYEQSHEVFAHKCAYTGCNASFQYPPGLKTHERKHTGKCLFPCLYCSRKYATNWAMKAHLKTHRDERIQCPKCPISFKTKAKYNQHKRGHHEKGYTLPCGEKPMV